MSRGSFSRLLASLTSPPSIFKETRPEQYVVDNGLARPPMSILGQKRRNLSGKPLFNKCSNSNVALAIETLRPGTTNRSVYAHDSQLHSSCLEATTRINLKVDSKTIWNNLTSSVHVAEFVKLATANPLNHRLSETLQKALISLYYLVTQEETTFAHFSLTAKGNRADSSCNSKRSEIIAAAHSVCEFLEYRNSKSVETQQLIIFQAVNVLLYALNSKSVSLTLQELHKEEDWLLNCLKRFIDVLEFERKLPNGFEVCRALLQTMNTAVRRIDYCRLQYPILKEKRNPVSDNKYNQLLENFLSRLITLSTERGAFEDRYSKNLLSSIIDIIGGVLGDASTGTDDQELNKIESEASSSTVNQWRENDSNPSCFGSTDASAPNLKDTKKSPEVAHVARTSAIAENMSFEELCFLQLLLDCLQVRMKPSKLFVRFVKTSCVNLFRSLSRLDDKRPLMRAIEHLATAASMSLECAQILVELLQNTPFLNLHIRQKLIFSTSVAVVIAQNMKIQDLLLKRGLFPFFEVSSHFMQVLRQEKKHPSANNEVFLDRLSAFIALGEIICETNLVLSTSSQVQHANTKNLNQVATQAFYANADCEAHPEILVAIEKVKLEIARTRYCSVNSDQTENVFLKLRPSLITRRHEALPAFVYLSLASAAIILERLAEADRTKLLSSRSENFNPKKVSDTAISSSLPERKVVASSHRPIAEADLTLFKQLMPETSGVDTVDDQLISLPFPAISPAGFHGGYQYWNLKSHSRLHIADALARKQVEQQEASLKLINSALAATQSKHMKPSLLMNSLISEAGTWESQFHQNELTGEMLEAPFRHQNLPTKVAPAPPNAKFDHRSKYLIQPSEFLKELNRPQVGYSSRRKLYEAHS